MSSEETDKEAEALSIQREQLGFSKDRVSKAEEEYDRMYRDIDEQSANYAKNLSQRNYISVGQANIARSVEDSIKNSRTQNQARGLTGANSSNFEELMRFQGSQAKGNLALTSRQAIFNQQQAMTGAGRQALAGRYQQAMGLQANSVQATSDSLFKVQDNITNRENSQWEIAMGLVGTAASVATAGVGIGSSVAKTDLEDTKQVFEETKWRYNNPVRQTSAISAKQPSNYNGHAYDTYRPPA